VKNTEIPNQTREDAINRMIKSRIGMLAHNPSFEYLNTMCNLLDTMLETCRNEMRRKLTEEITKGE